MMLTGSHVFVQAIQAGVDACFCRLSAGSIHLQCQELAGWISHLLMDGKWRAHLKQQAHNR
jgi:hypothetical protein